MKKPYHLFLIVMLTLSSAVAATAFAQNTPIPIDSLHFPDPVFRECIKNQLDDDNDGFLTFADRDAISSMGATSGQNNEHSLSLPLNISDLTGIEYFHNLTSLQVGNRHLTSLDVSQNTELTYLECYQNQLTNLNVKGLKKLKEIHDHDNPLSSLDVSGCTALTKLMCHENQLTSLNVSQDTALEILFCDYNLLLSLDVSGCTKLKDLRCAENLLTNLDLRQNTELTTLSCSYNQLLSLDVSGCTKLKKFYCSGNQLTSLDVSRNKALNVFYCNGNQLTSLDVSQNPALEIFNCDYNLLTSLDVSGHTRLGSFTCRNNLLTNLEVNGCKTMSLLECNSNLLTKLDVSSCTDLKELSCCNNRLSSLNVRGCTKMDEFYCSNNRLRRLDVSSFGELWRLEVDSNRLPLSEIYTITKKEDMAYRENYVHTPQSDTVDLSVNEALDLSREMWIDTTRTRWRITDMDGADLPIGVFVVSNGVFRFLKRRECKLVLTNDAVRDKDTVVTFTWIVNVPGRPVNIALQPNNAQWGEVSGYGEHERNADVTIVATPKDGYRFVEWQKEEMLFCTKPDTTFKAREHLTLIAVFEPIPTYAVELQVNNTEWGETLGSGVYREDSTVRIVAKAKRWGRFVNWTKGEEEFTTKADTTFKVGEDINLTANFEEYHVGKAYVKDRVVCLPYPMGRVQLFNAIGKMLYDGTGLAIPVSSKGTYILHAEGKNFKVMVP